MDLLQRVVVIYLTGWATQAGAAASVSALDERCEGDWNELRVAQADEIGACLRKTSRTPGPLEERRGMARSLRRELCRLFNAVHTLDLAFLEDEPRAALKYAQSGALPFLRPGEWVRVLGQRDVG